MVFGENFAEEYVKKLSDKILNASKKIDNEYSGDYDLWLDGIRIEVKASRVCDSDDNISPLYMKALSHNTSKNFLMNFQQLKPQCCDVFIWLAVYRDIIDIWIMNSSVVLNHPLFSKGQHRGNIGNEGQLHIDQSNIHQFDKYLLGDKDIVEAIKSAAKDY